ncbi:MAG: integrase core domain-containing protein [Candidatus Parvarchaeota archaeon]
MIVVEGLREYMSLREISSVSGISLSSFYYREKERSVIRLSPQIEYDIIRVASERPTYGYWKVCVMIRNNGIRVNRKAVRRVLREMNLSLPYSKHRGRTESRNIFHSTEPDQLWETDITYITTAQGLTYLMVIKDCFTKEWQGYNFSISCFMNALRAVGDSVLKVFDCEVLDGLIFRTDINPKYIHSSSEKQLYFMNLIGIHLKSPDDNGNIESFHASIKNYVWPYEFTDYREASSAIELAFNDYNEYRPHSSMDYLPPREFRRKALNDKSFREGYIKRMEVKLNE